MADDLTPDQVRARRFDAARKGYDRAQVDAFLADVVAEMERLVAAAESSERAALDVGIDDREALAGELDRIGGEVHAILEAARSAAAGIRTRASADADALTSEAKDASSRMIEDAVAQSQAMRASAWNEGTSLLAAAASEAKAIAAEAREDALFMRAEAEREALRLTGDAKRDREEIVRSARSEAEQMVEAARIESEGVLAAAHQQADAAQERARALEERRSELLAELEAARSAIGELEAEIDSRRQELESPTSAAEPEIEIDERSHHGEDGGSVRIVSPSRFAPPRPVDAEELVAEVTALRSGRTESTEVSAADRTTPVAMPIPEPSPEEVDLSEEPWEGAERVAEDDSVTVIPSTAPEPTLGSIDEEMPTPEMPPHPEVVAQEPPPSPVGHASIVAEPAVPPPGDEIGSLFARLRNGADEAPGPEPAEEKATERVADIETPDVHARGGSGDTASARPPEAAEPIAPREPTTGHGEIATTLPLQNAALRAIKRTLVDLQNETLEYLRTESGWEPDEAFTDRFIEPFASLTAEIAGEPDDSAGRAFATDLFDALSSAIERTRARGGGDREVASATSKVFRTWRADEAERRVASAAGDLAGV